jgi:hypothetical protein
MAVKQKPWGQVGTSNANLYTITNRALASVELTDFGAAVVQMNMQYHKGEIADVVLGYDKLQDYVDTLTYFGFTKDCVPLLLWTKFSAVKANIVHKASIFEKLIKRDLGASGSYHLARKED